MIRLLSISIIITSLSCDIFVNEQSLGNKFEEIACEEDFEFFIVVEKPPVLIGGIASVQQNVVYPDIARRAGIEGRVIVQFIVTENGEVACPKVVRGIGAGCDEAALEAVSKATFEPGLQRGKPVRVQYSLPITFKLYE